MTSQDKIRQQAEMLSNRVRSRFRYFSKRYTRNNIECFRLYDWDIPEIRAVIDWYAGHIVIGEYEHLQTGPDWLPQMAVAVGEALVVPPDRVHMKKRHTRTTGEERYGKPGSLGHRIEVRERDLRLLVNLDDFLDTGLFSDHRDTRLMVRDLAEGKNFLNLFAYTGSFTCAAAAGGAVATVTVDQSRTYIDWAKDNMELNGFTGARHKFFQSEVGAFLEHTRNKGDFFNFAFIDPPSFFRYSSKEEFDINRDHLRLINDALTVMAKGSITFFSTNHQRFKPQMDSLAVKDLIELTPSTIPEDYRNRSIHRCFKIIK